MIRSSVDRKSTTTTKKLIDRILISGQISRQEYLRLTSAILAYYQITEEECHQINNIFDYVQAGRFQIID
jgi:hypothetical protein